MKNVIWLFTVCFTLGIYACSSNSTEKVAEIEEITDSTPENIEEKATNEILVDDADSSKIEAIVSEKEVITENSKLEEKETDKPKDKPIANIEKPTVKPKPVKNTTKPPSSAPQIKDPRDFTNLQDQEVINVPPPPAPPKPKPVPKPIEEIEEEFEPDPVITDTDDKDNIQAQELKLSHTVWDQLLKKNVSNSGIVNYAGFKAEKTKLEAYLKHLEQFAPESNWSRNKEMAYWFNLYNAWTVKVIIDKYPVASITDIDGGKTWNVKRVKSGSKTYSLDEVENKVIRPKFNDGRIHFAVNCAAKSCPPLLNKAWTESNVQSYLEKQTKDFINNTSYNEISAKKVKISKIFEWYAADFGDIITYLNKYSNTPINKDAKVEYLEYDWKLNGN